ncbi:DUF2157 domain-containing protein [Desulfovibrio aerotolerans]|uniref:DUF2157 domain-containing protein n=1 Tax=Solidesulfovibrio aerotolerans TaxID=295255 RepID=A0A7C9MZ91_9BACT|nr:DUF2157 domain-containing protein [Solidesulfovibrio aerotolerans]MYL82177.1 DUF2157 domain-containing protein [Solidesulfovibrio aerotolerans]
MQVSKREAKFLRRAIVEWQHTQRLDPETAQRLTDDIAVIPFDWKALGKYSFLLSIICIIIALVAVISDDYLRELLHVLFNAPPLAKCAGMAATAGAIFTFGLRRRGKYPDKSFSNEAIFFLGVLAVAGAVYQLGLALGKDSGHFSLLILLSCLIYGVLGYFFRSGLIWLFALLSLGGWLGAETGYASGWGAYYLGMNYPLRFTLFGGLLTAAGLALQSQEKLRPFQHTTLVMGLLYLFIALWILSIFGNHGDEETWARVKQIELFHWSLLFALAAGWAIYYGLRHDNTTVKGFGLTFLFLNCYTRFFEFFWDSTNKVIFFVLLSVSFWGLGHVAEKLWRLGEKRQA